MSQSYSAITYWGISAPGHVKEVVYGINDIDKSYVYQIVYNIQLPGLKIFDSCMQMQTSTQYNYVSLVKEFQQHLSKKHRQNDVIGQGKNKKYSAR